MSEANNFATHTFPSSSKNLKTAGPFGINSDKSESN